MTTASHLWFFITVSQHSSLLKHLAELPSVAAYDNVNVHAPFFFFWFLFLTPESYIGSPFRCPIYMYLKMFLFILEIKINYTKTVYSVFIVSAKVINKKAQCQEAIDHSQHKSLRNSENVNEVHEFPMKFVFYM